MTKQFLVINLLAAPKTRLTAPPSIIIQAIADPPPASGAALATQEPAQTPAQHAHKAEPPQAMSITALFQRPTLQQEGARHQHPAQIYQKTHAQQPQAAPGAALQMTMKEDASQAQHVILAKELLLRLVVDVLLNVQIP